VLGPGGAVLAERELVPLGASEQRAVRIEVPVQLVPLHGRVLDVRGRPLSGAWVTLPAVRSEGVASTLGLRTDLDGEVSSDVSALESLRLCATRRGYLAQTREFAGVPADEIEFVLARAREASVEVRDEDGWLLDGGRLLLANGSDQVVPMAP